MTRLAWLRALLLLALVTTSCADPVSGTSDSGPTMEASPSVSPTASHDAFRVFIPPTQTEGDRVVLPIVFPDGTTAELVYPPDLDLATLGVRPYWAGCGRDFGFYYHDPVGTLYEGEPLQTWTRPDGQTVGLYEGVERDLGVDGEPIVYLIFHFGGWTIDVYDYGGKAALSDGEREACAMHLSASVTDEGWIVVSGPAEIALGGDEPELEFGGLGRKEPFILFFPGPCEPESDEDEELPTIGGVPVSLSKGFASWCHPGEMMRIHVYFTGEPTFVERLVKDLEVRDVHLAA